MWSFSEGRQEFWEGADIKISLGEEVRHTWYSLEPGREREGVLFIDLLIRKRQGLWGFFVVFFLFWVFYLGGRDLTTLSTSDWPPTHNDLLSHTSAIITGSCFIRKYVGWKH